MATAVGLNFKMTASIAKFQASMDKVEQKLKAIEGSSRQTAQGMKLLAALEIGKSVLSGLTGLFNIFKGGVSSVMDFSSRAAEAVDAIGKLSSSTGMAHEPLQVFTQMAAYGGVSSTQFGDALQKMSRGLGEAASGTGTAGKALERMGLSLNSLLSMSPDQQFLAIGSAIGEIEDPALRSQAAADIFGRSGTKLIPMFESLEDNARDTAQEMLELGQVLSGTQVRNIEAMNDSFEKVKKTAFSIGSQVLANFAPALTKANSALIELIKSFEYEGAKGGQGIANYLTDALFNGLDALVDWSEFFAQKLNDAGAIFLRAAEYFLKVADMLAWPFVDESAPEMGGGGGGGGWGDDEDATTTLGRLAEAAGETADRMQSTTVTFDGLREVLDRSRAAVSTATSDIALFGRENGIAGDELRQLALDAEKFGPNADLARAALDGMKDAATRASDPVKLFGEENGIAGEKLRQLALDAEKFGPNADLARAALDGMKDAANKATPAADLFGKNVGTSADELAAMARIQEDYSDNLRQAEDALDGLADSGVISYQQLEDLAKIVAESGGIHSELGQKLLAVADSAGKLDDVQKSLQRSMMKPAEDFANQRAEMLKRMGFNPFFVESQKEKWLAQQQEAVNKQIEIQRKAYEKFMERTGQGAGTAIKEALKETLDIDAEDTLPELKTQTATLGDILEAVKKQVFTQVVIP